MRYDVRCGDENFEGLTPESALIKAHELIARDIGDVYLYDEFGDPMGLRELEQIVDSKA